ncbi:MAG: PilZ domain-containing protein [Magnetococcales bacterium]|nr:PilZ domain-containing protein [Magnetococcales bacterium]
MEQHREFDRLRHDKVLVLELGGERRLKGWSRDVSLGGVFLEVEGSVFGVCVGDEGILRMMSGKDAMQFPCRVIRVAKNGLALSITEHQAQFGMSISHDIYHKMKNNLDQQSS